MPPVFVHQMPAINPGTGASNGSQHQRTTFRPPWVKEGPEPLPLPTAPWTLARTRQRAPEAQETAPVRPDLKPVPRKDSTSTSNNVAADNSSNSSRLSGAANNEPTPVRKTSKITIIPSRPSADAENVKENGHDASSTATANKKTNNSRTQEAANETRSSKSPTSQAKEIPIEIKSTTKSKQEEQKVKTSSKQQEQKQKSSSKQQEEPKQNNNAESKPPQPPAPPMPPPPMPGLEKKPMSESKSEKLEALKSRPRKRPDWGAMMKEVESGNRKLKHVQCNDRSSPLLPKVKVKDSFMYESEKPNVHNQLLKEIQSGIQLKKVQTNDRSKPQLDGLRKFRRQMTIEEQIQKAEIEEIEVEPDELDDIDKVRDDLQSTKQMLALEMRNKEAVERENKKLLTRILNLEVELEKERAAKRQTEDVSPQARREEDEQEKRKLKKDLEEAQRSAEEMEMKYHDTAGQLDMIRADLEEALRKNQALERKLQASLLNQDKGSEQPLRKQPSSKKLAAAARESNANMQQALGQQPKEEDEESEYEEETETETESSSEDEDTEALQERRMARELKLLLTKLKSFKQKEEVARKERHLLREQLKKQQKILSDEKKKYKVLQKEVDKMANLMKDDEEEGSEEEDEPEESEESESESESEESEEEESDGDLPPDAPAENRKQNLTERAKRHENCLAALRKGNYLLKANIDRIKDDLFKQKEMSLRLQEDLNSVLAELG